MNFLRNINKGFLLTVLVLIIFITYIVIVEVRRNNEKGIIKEVCESYISFENKYTIIPKEYWTTEGKINKDEYKNEMASKLKELMIDDEKIYNQQKSIVADKLEQSLIDTKIVLNKNSKNIVFKSFSFDLDQVQVVLENTLEEEYILEVADAPSFREDTPVLKDTLKYEDTITLKRENGTWKIVFADIETNYSENNRGIF